MSLTSSFSDYSSINGGNVGSSAGVAASADGTKYWSLERLKRSYLDYLSSKVSEVDEQKDARRYRHGSQHTAEQVKVLNRRKQPVMTYNRIGRKIDGVIGLVEKLKQSPKAYPRTPHEEQSADLATAVVREVLDAGEWKSKSYLVGQNAAIDGFAGIELILEQGDQGDADVSFEVVENDGFFYDPRSIRLDFSDCRYMGQGKWLDLDQAKELWPDHADDLDDWSESATELSTNSDRENKWFITDGYTKRVRVVDIDYILNGEWVWAQFTGNMKLDEGASLFTDEKNKSSSKYIMFSAQVDQDGDRYGFVRGLKSPQDEINARHSKMMHLLNARRLMAEAGAFDDIEVARREAIKPDGVVVYNKGFEAKFDDAKTGQEIQAHADLLVAAKEEIENFGPSPALIGQGGIGDKSGRAIQLLQQAGVAELGPFLIAYRGFKIRLYRGVWNAVRKHWTSERYIRVTDDQSVVQFIGVNQVQVDPMSGQPQMVNHLGALDVDIIMDEGPDTINSMADTFDALMALVQNGTSVPPDIILELAPGIDPDTRKRLIEKINAPNPQAQLAQQELQAQIQKIVADTGLAKAKTIDTMRGEQPDVQMQQPQQQDHPMKVQSEAYDKMASAMLKHAQTEKNKAETAKTWQDVQLEPQRMALEQHNAEASRMQQAQDSERNAKINEMKAKQKPTTPRK